MTNSNRKLWSVTCAASTAIAATFMLLTLASALFTALLLGNDKASGKQAGFNVVLAHDVTEERTAELKQLIDSADYSVWVRYTSADNAQQQWEEETGDDLQALLEENPLGAELEVAVKPEWAGIDSLSRIVIQLRDLEGVEDLIMNRSIDANNGNNAGHTMVWVSVVVALLLLIATITLSWATARTVDHRSQALMATCISAVVATAIACTIIATAHSCATEHEWLRVFTNAWPQSSTIVACVILAIVALAACMIPAWLVTKSCSDAEQTDFDKTESETGNDDIDSDYDAQQYEQ